MPDHKPRILFFFSDTGGGHRSAAEAIIEALQLEYGDRFESCMVDLFRAEAPFPFDHFPDWYPAMIRFPFFWKTGYRLIDSPSRLRWLYSLAWRMVRTKVEDFPQRMQADLIVSVHHAFNTIPLRAFGKDHPPYIIVVTDMVSIPALWINPAADMHIVATDAAREAALRFGALQDKVFVTGLPVAERFSHPAREEKRTLREKLEWPQDRPVIMIVGGGEGMGPLEKNAIALAEAGLEISLVVIAGRNQALRERLEQRSWPVPTRIYGFVRSMPEFMQATDILVTKAGPGTITEAINMGLPLVLYSRLPGQEDGNVTYVVSEGAGVWAPRPSQVVEAVRNWIEHPERYQAAAEACRRIARPEAARQIARLIGQRLSF